MGHIEKVEADLPRVRTIVAIGGHERWPDYGEWVAAQPADDPGVVQAGGDVAFQLYTSGTTGLPKGVMLTNDNFFSGVIGIAGQWRFTEDSVNLAVMPMFHIAGSGWSMVGLYYGCATVVLRDVDPVAILAAIPGHGVTNAFIVPAVIQFLLMTPGVESTDFSTLRAIVYGASPITDRRAHAGRWTSSAASSSRCTASPRRPGAITQLDGATTTPSTRPQLLRSCGKPYPWVEVRIVEPRPAATCRSGRSASCGPARTQNMTGYWNNPAATAEAVTADGWFKTGDAGYVDADGYLYLHDRVKDMIVSGGENVYPAEVENVLARHPGVADVAVIGVPDERWGEAVKAIVVPAAGTEPSAETEQDIIAFAREPLAGYKLPKSVDFAEVLPRNPSGKLLKRELREPYWSDRDRQIG